jgi:alpha-amylase
VAQALLAWIAGLTANFSADGLRIDTLPYVHPSFWQEFQAAAGGMHAIGEVDDGDVAFVSPWQAPSGANAAVSGLLSYPMFFTLRNVFQGQQSMTQLGQATQLANASYADPTLLGVFSDNHDNPRFMHGLNNPADVPRYKGALGWTLLGDGIPIVYYGSEWLYAGGNDPGCREPLWCPYISYNATAAPLGQFLAALNAYRRNASLWESRQVEAHSDDAFYAFSKGRHTLAVFTNVGTGGQPQTRTVAAAGLPPAWAPGAKVCNALDCTSCAVVGAAGAGVTLTIRGSEGVAVYDDTVGGC